MGEFNLFTIFFTGLFVGGLTCMAVQGGLLTTLIAGRTREKTSKGFLSRENAVPIVAFLTAKIITYTLLGFILGWLGSLFQLSLSTQAILQFAVAIFMVGVALNLLDAHPLFRYFILQPPKFLTRLVRNQSKSRDFFAPALLGAFTVFIPCGTTQAMMALAIASGNPFIAATIMFVFILGTSPLFFGLGYAVTTLSTALQGKFIKVAAFSIIGLAVFNANNALALTGTSVTAQSAWRSVYCTISFCGDTLGATNFVVNDAMITINERGYIPTNLTVKTGSDVTLRLVNEGGGGCTQSFTIPKLGIQKVVPIGTSDTINFKAPDKPGKITFTCSMGMYGGIINVI